MKRRLCSSALLLLAPLLAQSPADPLASLDIRAARNYVTVGSTYTLRVSGVTSLGGFAFNMTPVWRSLNPAIAHVDENGRVAGLAPGVATIEVSSGAVADTFAIRVLPARFELQPRVLDLDNGQAGLLRAVAYDASGRPITGVRYRWSSAFPGVASVDQNGAITTRSEGFTSVTVLIDGGPGYNVSAQAQVAVRVRPPWRLTTLVSNETVTRPVTLRSINMVSYAGADRMAAVGVLSNGSQALLSFETGTWRVLLIGGQAAETPSGSVQTIDNVSVNAKGEVLAVINRWVDNPGALLLFRNGTPSVVPHGFSTATGCCTNNLDIPSRTFPDNGDVLFTAQTPQGQQVVLRKANGARQIVFAGNENLAGFGQVWWINNPTYLGGRLLFGVNRPDRQAVYDWDGQTFRKLFAQNEALLGRAVRWWDLPAPTASGDIYARVGGDGFNWIVRQRANAWSTIIPKEQPEPDEIHPWGVHWMTDANNDGPLWVGDSEQGSGMFRIRGGRVEMVARTGQNAATEWTQFRQGFLRTQGDVLILGSQTGVASRLAAMTISGQVNLLDNGRSFDIAAPTALDWRSFVGNTVAGAPIFRSTGGMMMRVNKGSLQPAIAPGDTIDGRQLTSFDSVAASPNGDILFSASTSQSYSLFTVRGGRAASLLRDGSRVRTTTGGDLQINCCFGNPMAMNNRGQAVINANWEQTGGMLFVDANGAVRPVIQTNQALPGGGVFTNAYQAAIDESGRVMFAASAFDGSQGYYVWENGQLRRVLKVGEASPFGPVFNGGSPLVAAGDRFYLNFGFQNGGNVIGAYDGVRWQAVVSTGDTVLGSRMGGFYSNRFSVASNGDLAFMSWLPELTVVYRRADGTYRAIARGGDRTVDGEWFTGNFFDVAMTDAGDVYFSAYLAGVAQPRVALIQATPN